jgi:hypothetical protein
MAPLFMSTMGGRKNGGSHLSRKGLDLYQNVIKFIDEFRKNEAYDYDIFQRLCNNKAREYRIIKTLKDPEEGKDDNANVRRRAAAPVALWRFLSLMWLVMGLVLLFDEIKGGRGYALVV